jgi:hypothetical protein
MLVIWAWSCSRDWIQAVQANDAQSNVRRPGSNICVLLFTTIPPNTRRWFCQPQSPYSTLRTSPRTNFVYQGTSEKNPDFFRMQKSGSFISSGFYLHLMPRFLNYTSSEANGDLTIKTFLYLYIHYLTWISWVRFQFFCTCIFISAIPGQTMSSLSHFRSFYI